MYPTNSTIVNHPKYQTLLKRGYTHHQIQGMLSRRKQQQQYAQPNHYMQSPLHGLHIPQPSATPTPILRPQPEQPTSIDQSVMFSFQNVSNERRMHNARVQYPEHVPPRANIQMQFKPDKSSMEGILQDTYQQRHNDAYVPPAQPIQSPNLSKTHAPSLTSNLPNTTLHHTQSQQAPHTLSSYHASTKKQARSHESNQASITSRRKQFQEELNQLHNNTKEDPCEILGVSQNYTIRELAIKYKKKALKYHPDRLIKHNEYMTREQKEHCKTMFEKITKAYLYLIEQHALKESDKPFYELRKQSQHDTEEQCSHSSGTKIKLMDGDKFDVELFNKIYDKNRLHDVSDEGYGEWLKNDVDENTSKLFSSKFNMNVFNTTFEQLKHDNPYSEKQLVKRNDMGIITRGDTTAFSTLGEDNIDDFGGASGQLQYSDLKDAHTTNATLIDASRVHQQPQFKSVKEMEAHRSQIQHTMSPEEAEIQAYLKKKKEREEHARRERLESRDQLVSQHHQRLQQQLLQ